MKTTNVIAGVLIGVIAGAAIGILMAPDKGSETRRKLSERGRDLASTLKDSLNDIVDKAVDKYDDLRQNFTSMSKEAGTKMGAMNSNADNG
jgi:gas vesicle protein